MIKKILMLCSVGYFSFSLPQLEPRKYDKHDVQEKSLPVKQSHDISETPKKKRKKIKIKVTGLEDKQIVISKKLTDDDQFLDECSSDKFVQLAALKKDSDLLLSTFITHMFMENYIYSHVISLLPKDYSMFEIFDMLIAKIKNRAEENDLFFKCRTRKRKFKALKKAFLADLNQYVRLHYILRLGEHKIYTINTLYRILKIPESRIDFFDCLSLCLLANSNESPIIKKLVLRKFHKAREYRVKDMKEKYFRESDMIIFNIFKTILL